jgi:eukaryotic-like serine/threonine-protein kinase
MQLTKGVDARTDIWSLGVILFELLTGRPPFDAEAVTQLAIRIVNEPAPPLRSLRADAPEALEHVITMCLEKDRNRRFQTVGELAIALLGFGSKNARRSVESVLGTLRKAGISGASLPSTVPPPPAASGPALSASSGQLGPSAISGQLSVTSRETSASWGQTGGRPSSGGKVVAGIALAVVIGVSAVGGVLVLHKFGPTASSKASSKAVETGAAPAIEPPAIPSVVTAAAQPSTPTAVLEPETTFAASSLPIATSAPPATALARPGFPPFHPVAGARPAQPTSSAPPPSVPTASPPPAPKPNCNPPYVIDAAGNHQYKPECL